MAIKVGTRVGLPEVLFEARLASGMRHLAWLGQQASRDEAARAAEAKVPEAGS